MFKIIGNSVPVPVARALGNALRKSIVEWEEKQWRKEQKEKERQDVEMEM